MSDVIEIIVTPAPSVIEVLVVQPGPPGPSGDLAALLPILGYTHVQSVANTSWTVTHALPFEPSVTVVDSAGTEVEGGVQHTSRTTIILTFSGAFSGKAYLS